MELKAEEKFVNLRRKLIEYHSLLKDLVEFFAAGYGDFDDALIAQYLEGGFERDYNYLKLLVFGVEKLIDFNKIDDLFGGSTFIITRPNALLSYLEDGRRLMQELSACYRQAMGDRAKKPVSVIKVDTALLSKLMEALAASKELDETKLAGLWEIFWGFLRPCVILSEDCTPLLTEYTHHLLDAKLKAPGLCLPRCCPELMPFMEEYVRLLPLARARGMECAAEEGDQKVAAQLQDEKRQLVLQQNNVLNRLGGFLDQDTSGKAAKIALVEEELKQLDLMLVERRSLGIPKDKVKLNLLQHALKVLTPLRDGDIFYGRTLFDITLHERYFTINGQLKVIQKAFNALVDVMSTKPEQPYQFTDGSQLAFNDALDHLKQILDGAMSEEVDLEEDKSLAIFRLFWNFLLRFTALYSARSKVGEIIQHLNLQLKAEEKEPVLAKFFPEAISWIQKAIETIKHNEWTMQKPLTSQRVPAATGGQKRIMAVEAFAPPEQRTKIAKQEEVSEDNNDDKDLALAIALSLQEDEKRAPGLSG